MTRYQKSRLMAADVEGAAYTISTICEAPEDVFQG